MIPYIYKSNETDKISMAGLALLKDGKLIRGLVEPFETQWVNMLMNKYEKGVIEFPCTGTAQAAKKSKEVFEVISSHTKVTPKISDDEVVVHVQVRIKGSAGELQCSALITPEDEKRYETDIEATVWSNLQKTAADFQEKKLDVTGIGNQIYRRHPSLWKKWKPTWGERFSECQFKIDVDVDILNTGMNAGTPFSK